MARSNYNPKPFGFDDFQNTYYERLFGAADNITLSFYNNRVPKASLHSIFFALTYTQILKAPVVSFFFFLIIFLLFFRILSISLHRVMRPNWSYSHCATIFRIIRRIWSV